MNKKQTMMSLGCICLILTMCIVVQIRTINNANKIASRSFSNNELRDQVLRWKERYDIAYTNLQEAQKTLESVRQKAAENII